MGPFHLDEQELNEGWRTNYRSIPLEPQGNGDALNMGGRFTVCWGLAVFRGPKA